MFLFCVWLYWWYQCFFDCFWNAFSYKACSWSLEILEQLGILVGPQISTFKVQKNFFYDIFGLYFKWSLWFGYFSSCIKSRFHRKRVCCIHESNEYIPSNKYMNVGYWSLKARRVHNLKPQIMEACDQQILYWRLMACSFNSASDGAYLKVWESLIVWSGRERMGRLSTQT